MMNLNGVNNLKVLQIQKKLKRKLKKNKEINKKILNNQKMHLTFLV